MPTLTNDNTIISNWPVHAPAAPPKVLVKKLCAIMAEAEGVIKRGENTHFKYEYVKEEDVVALFRPLLAKHGVFIFHSVIDERKENTLTAITVQYTFSCQETGESFSVLAKGYGVDNQDKGLYKALTGCHKYFLLKNFNLPTGEDPENDFRNLPLGGGNPIPQTQNVNPKPPSAALGTYTGADAFIIPFGKFKDQPIGVLTDAQLEKDLKYWEDKLIATGEPAGPKLASYMDAMRQSLSKRNATFSEDISL